MKIRQVSLQYNKQPQGSQLPGNGQFNSRCSVDIAPTCLYKTRKRESSLKQLSTKIQSLIHQFDLTPKSVCIYDKFIAFPFLVYSLHAPYALFVQLMIFIHESRDKTTPWAVTTTTTTTTKLLYASLNIWFITSNFLEPIFSCL